MHQILWVRLNERSSYKLLLINFCMCGSFSYKFSKLDDMEAGVLRLNKIYIYGERKLPEKAKSKKFRKHRAAADKDAAIAAVLSELDASCYWRITSVFSLTFILRSFQLFPSWFSGSVFSHSRTSQLPWRMSLLTPIYNNPATKRLLFKKGLPLPTVTGWLCEINSEDLGNLPSVWVWCE